jgi:hypothetical protein
MGLPLAISRYENALLREHQRTGLMAVRLNTIAAEALYQIQAGSLSYVTFGAAIKYAGYKGSVFHSVREVKNLYSVPLSLEDWLDVSLWSLQLIRKGSKVMMSA